jgi:drug/metabolite transporter (DMT)-like permease
MEMLVGGVVLLLAAAAHGDLGRVPWSQVGAGSWFALAHLIGPGSILAFTAYGYALTKLPLSTVSTYAHVNPVVAVLLGAVILSERLGAHEAVGTALVVASVVVALQRRAVRREAGTEPETETEGEVAGPGPEPQLSWTCES